MSETPPQLPPDIDYRPPAPEEGLSSGAKWGIGCSIGCLITLLVAGLAAYGIWVKVREFGANLLDRFTSGTPIVFVAPPAETAEVEGLVARVDAFSEALEQGADTGPLELDGRAINLLIHHHPGWKDLAGRAEVAIDGNQFTARISLPLDAMGSLLAGRYLNGKATVRLALENGALEGYLDDVEVGGRTLPPEIMAQLKSENFFQDARSDVEFRHMMKRLESLRIEAGRLIIVPKPAGERQPDPPPPLERGPAAPPASPPV